MSDAIKHVIHCSGYSIAENPELPWVVDIKKQSKKGNFGDWEHVCIGDGLYGDRGRIPTALVLAGFLEADCLIWSTGASWLPDGGSEARFSYYTGMKLLEEAAWNHLIPLIEKVSIFDEKSINTSTSMEVAAKLIKDRFADETVMLHLISSANHMPRVMRDAIKVFGGMENVFMSGVPAGTSYGNKTPADVVIYELGEPRTERRGEGFVKG
jgi:hypothetical protein